jgi:hypothetical protein
VKQVKDNLVILLFRMFRLQQETAEVELASVASFCESVETSLSK